MLTCLLLLALRWCPLGQVSLRADAAVTLLRQLLPVFLRLEDRRDVEPGNNVTIRASEDFASRLLLGLASLPSDQVTHVRKLLVLDCLHILV